MAEHAETNREFDKAIKFYKEALTYDPEDKKAMIALAKLYMIVS